MGVRESLLNTITSVADSDFVRIVTSAGASSKATVRNLFKGFESNLGAKSSLTTSDYIRVVGSDNVSYKQLVSDVAKKIIENYTGSSLAGSSQSVKSALDSLNSKMAHICRDTCRGKNLDSMNTTNDYGIYWYNGWGSADVGGTLPFTNATGILFVMDNGYGGKGQAMWNLSTGKVFRRAYENSSWSSWASS